MLRPTLQDFLDHDHTLQISCFNISLSLSESLSLSLYIIYNLKNIIEETGHNALRESLSSPERSFAMVANSPERSFAKVTNSPERSLETGFELPTGVVREVRFLPREWLDGEHKLSTIGVLT